MNMLVHYFSLVRQILVGAVCTQNWCAYRESPLTNATCWLSKPGGIVFSWQLLEAELMLFIDSILSIVEET